MLAYWCLFVMWMLGALQSEWRPGQEGRYIYFLAAAAATTLMIGLRLWIGGDWASYQRMYEVIFHLTWLDSFAITDPGYATLNWISSRGDFGIAFVNLACGALFMTGFACLAWRQPNPALAVLVGVPYLIIVVAMGYTRQAAAIGLICFALADLSERRLLRLFVCIGLAALFHKTALLLLPIALLPILRRSIAFSVLGAALFAVLFVLLLRDSSDRMISNYVDSTYDSQGAGIRVAMNVFAAGLFLLLRKRFDIPQFQKSFWTTSSILALLSVPALAASTASAGVDRLSLYLIPLQAVVYSRLPYTLSGDRKALPSVLIAVIGYCFAVQFVWLNYADNVVYWVPYQMGFSGD